MKLLTKEIWNRLVELGEQDVPNPLIPLKFFTPDSNWTWYVASVSGIYLSDGTSAQAKVDEVPTLGENGIEDVTFFGFVCGLENEVGYFSLSDITGARGALGLKIERDMYFKETRLDEIKEKHKRIPS